MGYAIDTDGTRAVGSTLRTGGAELRDCGTTFAYAAGLARLGAADSQPGLARAVHDFTTTHLALIEAVAAACSGLGRDLTWAAQSAHEVELAVAADLGAARAVPPVDSVGMRV